MQKKLMLTNFGNQQLLKAIEEMRRLGILMNPPSKLGEFPLREFHLVGHTTLDSNELRHGLPQPQRTGDPLRQAPETG